MAIPGGLGASYQIGWTRQSQSLSSNKANTGRLLDPIHSQISEDSVSDFALRDVTPTNLSGETEATKVKLDCKGPEP